MGKISGFMRLPAGEKMLFLEALSLHLITGLALKVIPFRKIPVLFKSRQSLGGSQQSAMGESIRMAIQRAARVSPWRNKCLVSSLAARRMMQRRKLSSMVHLGVAKNTEGKTVYHAWAETEGYEIVARAGDYIDLYVF